jgi:hypothetical protein
MLLARFPPDDLDFGTNLCFEIEVVMGVLRWHVDVRYLKYLLATIPLVGNMTRYQRGDPCLLLKGYVTIYRQTIDDVRSPQFIRRSNR